MTDQNALQQPTPISNDMVLSKIENGVAILTLNNPGKRNPLSLEILEVLGARLEDAAKNPEVRAVVISHRGPAFSAGHNIRELVGTDLGTATSLFTASSTVMAQIRNMPKPVIAQVEGLASAAGCQLAATCDLIVAAETAAFQTPGVMIGLFCSTPMVPLTRVLPSKVAMEMLLTGHPLSARDAERLGMVNRVVSAERLPAETMALAQDIIAYSAQTLAMGKEAFYRQLSLPVSQAYRLAQETMTANALTEDAQEGLSAFLEKRPPNFKH